MTTTALVGEPLTRIGFQMTDTNQMSATSLNVRDCDRCSNCKFRCDDYGEETHSILCEKLPSCVVTYNSICDKYERKADE